MMKKNKIISSLLAQTLVLTLGIGLTRIVQAEAPPSAEEMWKIIQQQQLVIEQLQSQILQNNQKVEEVAVTVEDAVEAVEVAQTSSGSTWADKTTVGGYGELHYNNLSDDNPSIGGDDSRDRVDFHRFVLYFSHSFTDSIRFFSEFELEHSLAGDDKPGEIELEQAWLELDINNQHHVRAGLDILPIGLVSFTHEPNTFYGVERNTVEAEIIPSTWWEAGIGLNGEVAPGWNYDLIAHSGLAIPTSGSSTLRPRSGRRKVAEFDDPGFATTGRLRYTGIPGLEVGISGQYQADASGKGDDIDLSATLLEGQVDYKHSSGFGLRALYARWDFDNTDQLGTSVNQDDLAGWYVEPAFRFAPGTIPGEIGLFARYSQYDARDGITGGNFVEYDSWVVGANWWPHNQVVFKFDYQNESADSPADTLRDGFNLGLGYQF